MEKELLLLISDTLSIPLSSLSRRSSSENTENWDSLAHMNIIFAVEEKFGIEISDDDLPQSMSVERLLKIIEKD